MSFWGRFITVSVILYVILTIAFCAYMYVREKNNVNSKTLFFGTGSHPLVLLIGTVAASFSSWVLTGGPSVGFTGGMNYVLWVIMYQAGIYCMIGYLAPRVVCLARGGKFLTMADFFSSLYEKTPGILHHLIALICLLGVIPHLTAQMLACGLIINVATESLIPQMWGAIFIALVVMTYMLLGGFHGGSIIETFQGLLFLCVLWGGLFACFYAKRYGVVGLFNELNSYNEALVRYQREGEGLWTMRYAISFTFILILGTNLNAGIFLRFLTAKDAKSVLNLTTRMPLMTGLFISVPACIMGAFALVLNNVAEVQSADVISFSLLSAIHPFWGVLVTLGILSAAMSTISGTFNLTSMIFTMDFAKRFIKGKDDSFYVKLGRVWIVFMAVIAIYMSLNTNSGVQLLMGLVTSFAIINLYPCIGTFMWPRATKAGIVSAMIVNMLLVCYFTITRMNPLGFTGGFWAFLAGVAVFVIVSLVTKPVPAEERAAFMKPLLDHKVREKTVVR